MKYIGKYIGLLHDNYDPNIRYLVQKDEYLFACSENGYVVKETRPGIHEAVKNGYKFKGGEHTWGYVDDEEREEIRLFLWPMVIVT